MKAPEEMKLEKSKILKAFKSVYGLPEPSMHYHKMCADHNTRGLNMKGSSLDLCRI